MNTRTSGGNLYKVKFKGFYCLVILWPFAKVNKDAYSMQYGDLASTPDCEKDSLLGLTAPMQNLFQIFEITVLIGSNYLLYFLIFIHRLHHPWSINSGPYYSHTVANRTRLSAGFTVFSLFSNRFKAIKFRLSWFEKTFYFAKTQVFWRLGHTAVAYNISFSVSWTVAVATIRSFSRKCLRSQIGLIGSFAISLAVLIYIQIVTSPEGGEGHLDRDTVTDMCVDLTCCLDTLEQDTTCPYGSVLSRWQYRQRRGEEEKCRLLRNMSLSLTSERT